MGNFGARSVNEKVGPGWHRKVDGIWCRESYEFRAIRRADGGSGFNFVFVRCIVDMKFMLAQ